LVSKAAMVGFSTVKFSGAIAGITIKAEVKSWMDLSARVHRRLAMPLNTLVSIAIGLMFNSAPWQTNKTPFTTSGLFEVIICCTELKSSL